MRGRRVLSHTLRHHVDAVKLSGDRKHISCGNQSNGLHCKLVNVSHYIQQLIQEITVVWAETSLSAPFMSSQKLLCAILAVFLQQ